MRRPIFGSLTPRQDRGSPVVSCKVSRAASASPPPSSEAGAVPRPANSGGRRRRAISHSAASINFAPSN